MRIKNSLEVAVGLKIFALKWQENKIDDLEEQKSYGIGHGWLKHVFRQFASCLLEVRVQCVEWILVVDRMQNCSLEHQNYQYVLEMFQFAVMNDLKH